MILRKNFTLKTRIRVLVGIRFRDRFRVEILDLESVVVKPFGVNFSA